MKTFISLAAAALLGTSTQAATLAGSTFDANDEGWTLGEFVLPANSSSPVYNAVAGRIETTDVFGYNAFVAPTAFLGDKSAAFGGTFRLDLSSQQNDDFAAPIFSFQSGGTVIFARSGAVPSTDAANPTTYSISLVGASFATGTDNSGTVTDAELQAVLASLDRVTVNADWNTGPDFVTLDNVYFCSSGACPAVTGVPEPAMWGMMIAGFGLAGAASRRRRTAVVNAKG